MPDNAPDSFEEYWERAVGEGEPTPGTMEAKVRNMARVAWDAALNTLALRMDEKHSGNEYFNLAAESALVDELKTLRTDIHNQDE